MGKTRLEVKSRQWRCDKLLGRPLTRLHNFHTLVEPDFR